MQELIMNDTSPNKIKSLNRLVPEIRENMHKMDERQMYKSLFPLAKLGTCDLILRDILQKELLDVMRKNRYRDIRQEGLTYFK